MKSCGFKRTAVPLSDQDHQRRKREILIIAGIIVLVAVLTVIETKVIDFGSEFPISDTILMFTVINLNLLLLLLLIFLVFRNIVKLLYDRRRKVMGASLRARLAAAFVLVTLIPTTVLFFFSVNFIKSSFQFWFNAPIEQALQNALFVGRQMYEQIEARHRFCLEQIAHQIKVRKLINEPEKDILSDYIRSVRYLFRLDAVEVYSPDAHRIAAAVSSSLTKNLPPMVADDLLRELKSKPMRSVSEFTDKGELSRTITTVPFESYLSEAEAIVVVSTLISERFSESLTLISKGIEEYQQINLLKDPIRITYYLTISIIALLVMFGAIWFGFYLAKTISVPIRELAEGARRIAEGDFTVSIAPASDEEIGSLVEAFNRMTKDLRVSRDQLEQSASILRRQNAEIEERRKYMEIVLKNASTGVITLDARGVVSTINTSAERMLNVQADQILDRHYTDLLEGRLRDIAEEVGTHLSESTDNTADFTLRVTIDGSPRSFLIHVSVLKNDENQYMGLVMVFDDLTEQEKAQRIAAWREVARRIAHEVKNPLTPISLSAQRLKRKYSHLISDPVFDECTRMIIDHVELIRNLVNEFSTFARFPTANPRPCDLPPIIEETIALYREGHPNIQFVLNLPDALPKLSLDRQHLKQAMINLVDNAVAAIRQEGVISIAVKHIADEKTVQIEVSDTGVGISDEEKEHLFEPYFSTKKFGMGLGLSIVNSIIADHHGTIRVQDNSPCGAKFIIELPA